MNLVGLQAAIDQIMEEAGHNRVLVKVVEKAEDGSNRSLDIVDSQVAWYTDPGEVNWVLYLVAKGRNNEN